MTDAHDLADERLTAAVLASFDSSRSERFGEIMRSLVRHLHAFVREVELTEDEWFAGIDFLTRTGHTTTDQRQEWVLLSDVLGVSMLVDASNHRRPTGATENTILGPFYVPQAPRRARGANICLDGKGEPLVVGGIVRDTKGDPIPAALIDVWQTNDDGFYDVQQKGVQPGWNLRGVFTTEADGSYRFRSVKPRFYPIPDDGPVGKLLGRLGRHPNRAAHIHFIVNAPGFDPLITHIFPPDCVYLDEDAVFGVKESLIANFRRMDQPGSGEDTGLQPPYWAVDWGFVLSKAS